MALDINSIYLFCYDAVLNKLQSGQTSDSTFNTSIAVINLELFRKYSGIPEDYRIGSPIPKMGWQNSTVISDSLSPFIKTTQITRATNNYFPYPSDYSLWSSLTYDYVKNGQCATPGDFQVIPLEDLTDADLRTRNISSIKPPSLDYPVFGWNQLGFEVYPKQLNTLNLTYLQTPTTPYRDFTQLANGQTIYNPNGLTVQFQWPQSMYYNICVRICAIYGMSIREDAVVAWMNEKIEKGSL